MRWIRPYLIVLIIIAVWSIGSMADLFNPYLIPPPWKVVGTAWKLIANGALFRHMAVSFYRIVIGFAITFCLAFPMGLLVGLNKTKPSRYGKLPLIS